MAQSSSQSVIVVGGGITGLTVAVALQTSGYQVTLIACDAPEDTVSGVAAGMVAPALEAIGDHDPVSSFRRLKAAQTAWLDLQHLWPQPIHDLLAKAQIAPSLYIWSLATGAPDSLSAMAAACVVLRREELAGAGFDAETAGGVRIIGDWLFDAADSLLSLQTGFEEMGGQILRAAVRHVTAKAVTVVGEDGLAADHVVIAAGYGARLFAEDVPVLANLTPIKGHLLDIAGRGHAGVIRSARGYFADYGAHGKFGATMQAGQADLAIEPDRVAELVRRADEMNVAIEGSTPRTGIRASTPDGWPMIGRDPASGVLVATGMRRNGYIFAPLAAQIILALIEGRDSPDGGIYRPDRFTTDQN